MHYPSDNIPWHLIASKLHWAPGQLPQRIRDLNLPQNPGKLKDKTGCACGVTNLHPNSPPFESGEKNEFAQAFAQAVSDASKLKRAQYPKYYSAPSPSDVLLGDELVEKVESFLSQETKGGPKLPFEQRTASAFLHPWECGDHCNFTSDTDIGFLNLEVVKMLLMLGELDPILRACAHPDEGLSGWYSAALCDCMVSTVLISLIQVSLLTPFTGESLCYGVGYGHIICSESLRYTQYRSLFPGNLGSDSWSN